MLSGLENPVHIMFILAVLLIVFGPKRLPELGRNLGRGIRDFRSALVDHEYGGSAPPSPPPTPPAVVESSPAVVESSHPAAGTATTHPPTEPPLV